MATSIAAMRRVSRAGFWFGTADTHTYRISKVFYGTAKTNFTLKSECRPHVDAEGNEDTDWTVLRDPDRGDRTLKDAKMWCWYHDQRGLRDA